MAKQYEIKNVVLWGTSWGNKLGTYQKRNPHFPPPSPKPQKEKIKPPEPSHWQHEIFISKLVCHPFQPPISGCGGERGGEEGWVEFRQILR